MKIYSRWKKTSKKSTKVTKKCIRTSKRITMITISVVSITTLVSCNKTFHLFRTEVIWDCMPIILIVRDCIEMSEESHSLVSQISTLVTIALFSQEAQVELIFPLLNTQLRSIQVTKKCTLCSKTDVILSITIFQLFLLLTVIKWAIISKTVNLWTTVPDNSIINSKLNQNLYRKTLHFQVVPYRLNCLICTHLIKKIAKISKLVIISITEISTGNHLKDSQEQEMWQVPITTVLAHEWPKCQTFYRHFRWRIAWMQLLTPLCKT